jgi:regulatory protein
MRRPGQKTPLTALEQGDPNHAHAYAIALLARRDYSSRELTRKLEDRGYLEIAVGPVVEDLLASNKLNDERYGNNVVAYRSRRGQGPARIRSELMRSGLSRDAIDEAVKGDDAPDFIERARAVRARKFGPDLPKDWKERSKQARFLQYRGFSTDHIRAVLEGDLPDGEPDSDQA